MTKQEKFQLIITKDDGEIQEKNLNHIRT